MQRARETQATNQKTRDRRGATSVEFTFIAPLFLLIIFGMVEFGRVMMIQHAITNAAREGCRKAVLASTDDPDEVEDTVREFLKTATTGALDEEIVRVDVPDEVSKSTKSGTELTVSVEVDFAKMSWLPFGGFGLISTLGAASTQECE